MKYKFRVTLATDITIDSKIMRAVLTDEWRKQFYDLHTPEDVAKHLAYNLVQGRSLKELAGFADQPDSAAVAGELDIEEVWDL